jgi:hypothetical protein
LPRLAGKKKGTSFLERTEQLHQADFRDILRDSSSAPDIRVRLGSVRVSPEIPLEQSSFYALCIGIIGKKL